jgi:hypothetical protein
MAQEERGKRKDSEEFDDEASVAPLVGK